MQLAEISILEKVDFPTLSVSFRSDGIVNVQIQANDEIDVKHVIQVVDALEKVGKAIFIGQTTTGRKPL